MDKKYYIKSFCHITNNSVRVKNKVVFEDSNPENTKSFLKDVYKNLDIKYPKFFKMDNLSKLAFLGAEYILEDNVKENTAIVFSNNASSLDTDRKHQESIKDVENYFPSPAVFVYTLPNIGIGEISIRQKLKSENGFFIFEKFNSSFHFNYESNLLNNSKTQAILGGWINIDNDKIDSFLYFIDTEGELEYTEQNINNIYNSK